MQEIFIAGAAGAGALALSFLGFTNSKEPFDMRKFIGSAITAVVSGVGVAVTFNYDNGVTIISYMTAFLTGVGADAGRKVIADSIRGGK